LILELLSQTFHLDKLKQSPNNM